MVTIVFDLRLFFVPRKAGGWGVWLRTYAALLVPAHAVREQVLKQTLGIIFL